MITYDPVHRGIEKDHPRMAEKPAREAINRVVVQLARRVELDDPAILHQRDPIGEGDRFRLIVELDGLKYQAEQVRIVGRHGDRRSTMNARSRTELTQPVATVLHPGNETETRHCRSVKRVALLPDVPTKAGWTGWPGADSQSRMLTNEPGWQRAFATRAVGNRGVGDADAAYPPKIARPIRTWVAPSAMAIG